MTRRWLLAARALVLATAARGAASSGSAHGSGGGAEHAELVRLCREVSKEQVRAPPLHGALEPKVFSGQNQSLHVLGKAVITILPSVPKMYIENLYFKSF